MSMHIGIMGAGIMGRTLAFLLARNGFKVEIFEKDSFFKPTSCSYTAAGLLSPFAELTSALHSIVDIGLLAIEIWQSIIQLLKQKVFFQAHGTLFLAHPENYVDLLRFIEVMQLEKYSLNYQRVKTKDYEVQINSIMHEAIYIAQEAQLDAQMLMNALGLELQIANVVIHSNTEAISKKNIIYVRDKEMIFDWVLDCRGLGAKKYLNNLRGVRGELIHLHAPQVNIKRVLRVFHPHYPIYIIPRPNNHYIVGASCIDSEDKSPMTVRTALELLSNAYSVHRGFSEAKILNMPVHCRPAFENNLPKIDLHIDCKMMSLNGLYRYGYLFAPFFSQCIVDFFTTGLWNEMALPFIKLHHES